MRCHMTSYTNVTHYLKWFLNIRTFVFISLVWWPWASGDLSTAESKFLYVMLLSVSHVDTTLHLFTFKYGCVLFLSPWGYIEMFYPKKQSALLEVHLGALFEYQKLVRMKKYGFWLNGGLQVTSGHLKSPEVTWFHIGIEIILKKEYQVSFKQKGT